jgi:hypothetical protein
MVVKTASSRPGMLFRRDGGQIPMNVGTAVAAAKRDRDEVFVGCRNSANMSVDDGPDLGFVSRVSGTDSH